jgi:hypothetical protein
MLRSTTSLTLATSLLAALALSACTREASDPALESDRSARAEADATERHPVAASPQSGAGQLEQDRGDAATQVAGRDPLDVLDPRQRDVPAPAEDPSLAAQTNRAVRNDALARCATLAPRDRSDCESYAMSETEDDFDDAGTDADADAGSDPDAAPAQDEDDR